MDDLSTDGFASGNSVGLLTSQVDEVVVLQAADSLELSTDVELASSVEEVLYGRMSLVVVTENLGSLKSPGSIVVNTAALEQGQMLEDRSGAQGTGHGARGTGHGARGRAGETHLSGLYMSSMVKMARLRSSRKSRSVIFLPGPRPSSSIVDWDTSRVMGMEKRMPLARRFSLTTLLRTVGQKTVSSRSHEPQQSAPGEGLGPADSARTARVNTVDIPIVVLLIHEACNCVTSQPSHHHDGLCLEGDPQIERAKAAISWRL
jgi:hypothetical protein